MQFNRRQKSILKCLLEAYDYQPTEHIAELTGVSKKTVYREIAKLRQPLKAFHAEIETKIGTGIRIVSDVETRNRLNLEIVDNSRITIDHRRYEILIDLLQNAPQTTSIKKLSDTYFVSMSSIQNDLKFIEEWLSAYQLQLIKNPHGTCIQGSEINIRKALTNAIIKYHVQDMNTSAIVSDRIDADTRYVLYEQFDKEIVDYVEYLVDQAEKELRSMINDPYYINIITHVLILIQRVRNGKRLENSLCSMNNVDIHIFRIAVEMATDIKQKLKLEIPDVEIYYIYQHLETVGYSGTEMMEDKEFEFANLDSKNNAYGALIIEKMGERTDERICCDNHLKRYLLLHLHSMIGRQRYQIEINCPLLSAVKTDYRQLFEITRSVVEEATQQFYPSYTISEDELAYLTLYFQGSLEVVQLRKLRVLVVCSSGIGTSHLLMTRIKKTFPDWEIVDMIAAAKLNDDNINLNELDLIVSTVNIAHPPQGIPLAFVSVLFSENDIQNVKEVISR